MFKQVVRSPLKNINNLGNFSNFSCKGTDMKRGALIVLEGCDKAGKSTQCRKLIKTLNDKGIPAKLLNFPDRTTPVGKLISQYLSKEIELPDKAIHLLFSANRWELEPKIIELLKNGTTLIIDRYSYSGVAFSGAKPNMDMSWCWQMEIGLPKPDIVLFLQMPIKDAASRQSYGTERYENEMFQSKVLKNFDILKDSIWKEINADDSVENVHQSILEYVEQVIEEVSDKPIQLLT